MAYSSRKRSSGYTKTVWFTERYRNGTTKLEVYLQKLIFENGPTFLQFHSSDLDVSATETCT